MIPEYRAKKIDSDEWVEGYYLPEIDDNASEELMGFEWFDVLRTMYGDHYQDIAIDPETIAIHFPNMLDKNGKKIFASLSEDGVGGDEFVYPFWSGWNEPQNKMVAVFDNGYKAKFVTDGKYTMMSYKKCEVIGIHNG